MFRGGAGRQRLQEVTVNSSRKETSVKKLTAIVLAASLGGSVSLGGCADNQMSREEMLGTAAGAAVGGILGYQIGGGMLMNSLFATRGTVGGGAAGYVTTRALMGSDRVEYDRTAQKGLAQSNDGQVLDWQNPETGHSGIFRPIRSFRMADGRFCRQYRTTVSFKKDVHSSNGMACRQPGGEWQVVSDDFS